MRTTPLIRGAALSVRCGAGLASCDGGRLLDGGLVGFGLRRMKVGFWPALQRALQLVGTSEVPSSEVPCVHRDKVMGRYLATGASQQMQSDVMYGVKLITRSSLMY